MLLPWILLLLSRQLLERPDDAEPCVSRLDDIVDITVACCIVWISDKVVILLGVDILQNLYGSFCSHYGNVG